MIRRTLVAAALATVPLAARELLDPLVVTVGRIESEPLDTPYSFDRIDAGFLRDNTRRTLPEALQFTPGVLVQKTTHGHGSPFIRGFTGRQNLLLVDGVRFNNSLFRGGPIQYWNTVDPYSLDRIELTKSQGSVLYGSDAVGGTLNAFTRSSRFRDQAGGEAFTTGSAYCEFRSNGDGSHVGRVESAFGVGGRFGVLLGVTAKDFGDIRDSGVGLMRNTGYPEQDLDLRADIALGPDATLTVVHQNVNQDDIWRWHSTLHNPGWQHDGHVATRGSYNHRIYDQERSLTYLRAAGERADGPVTRWSATLSYQTTRDSESQDRSASDRRYQTAGVDTIGFDLSLESPVGPGLLVYGVDYYHDEVDSTGYRDRGAGLAFDPSFRPVADDSSYDLLGAYAQYVWELNERLELTAGGRYTHARAELGRYYDSSLGADVPGAARDWDDFTGSLRGLFRVNECWSLFAGATQAFRAPNLNDLSGNLTTRSGVNNAGSIDVEPEEFVTWEIGARHDTADHGLSAAVFYTDIDDIITSVADGSGGSVTTNGRDGYLYGVELEGWWRLSPCWTLSGFAAWQDGRSDTPVVLGGPTVHEPASRVMPLTGSLALRWTHPGERLWVEGRILAASAQEDLSLSDRGDTQRIPVGGTPGYVTAMLHAGWQATDFLELTCGLENLTDEDYRNHGSGQNEPGFGAILGARMSW